MNVCSSSVAKLLITNVKGLDAVAVYLEDHGPGRGKITITCFNDCWSYFWGAMGDDTTIRQFFLSCDNGYIANKLSPGTDRFINDFDALEKHAKKRIISRRKDGDFSKDDARVLYDKSCFLDGVSCFEEISDHDFMWEVFGDDWWMDFPRTINHEYEYLCRIIDAVKEAIRQRGEA